MHRGVLPGNLDKKERDRRTKKIARKLIAFNFNPTRPKLTQIAWSPMRPCYSFSPRSLARAPTTPSMFTNAPPPSLADSGRLRQVLAPRTSDPTPDPPCPSIPHIGASDSTNPSTIPSPGARFCLLNSGERASPPSEGLPKPAGTPPLCPSSW
jgi:hypothetical protein